LPNPRCSQASKNDRYAANVLPIIREAQKADARTLREIAEALNSRGMARARVSNVRPKRREHPRAGIRASTAGRAARLASGFELGPPCRPMSALGASGRAVSKEHVRV
jgi:hypothetical protein